MIAKPELALAMRGLTPHGVDTDPRTLLGEIASAGYRSVQLDITHPALRPRGLDRSARRDLGALLRRLGLRLSGLDLFIPPEHFAKSEHVDRAVEAAKQGLSLAEDLAAMQAGDGVVSLVLPEQLAEGVAGTLASASESRGVRVADHAWPRNPRMGIEVGLDPAAVLAHGGDVVAAAATGLAAARLNDLGSGGRIEPGSRGGRLDGEAYSATLVTFGFKGAVVADLLGVVGPMAAAKRVLAWWGEKGQ